MPSARLISANASHTGAFDKRNGRRQQCPTHRLQSRAGRIGRSARRGRRCQYQRAASWRPPVRKERCRPRESDRCMLGWKGGRVNINARVFTYSRLSLIYYIRVDCFAFHDFTCGLRTNDEHRLFGLWLLKDTTARAHPCLLPTRVIIGLREFLLIQEFMV